MGWTANRTWTAGEIVTAAILNSAVRDNLNYLKGVGQVPTIESGLVIDNTDGDEYLKLPLLSTAETGTVLNAEGKAAFDEQTHRIKFRDRTSVRSLVSTADVDDTPVNGATTDPVSSNWAYDHVAAADPHPGYILESLADNANDFLVASANNTFVKKTLAETRAILSSALISSGTYTGNSSANRAITHSLGGTPKTVFIFGITGYYLYYFVSYLAGSMYVIPNTGTNRAVTTWTNTYFYVGNASDYSDSANLNTIKYYWVAIG